MVKEVTRIITPATQNMLWGKSAGRCEFAGCNKALWLSSITNQQVNIAQKAHIWAFSSAGPRGNEGVDSSLLNSLDNLMLVCHQCHRLIDQDSDGETYSVELLQLMKSKHEHRIDVVTSISPEMQSTILLYGANIGQQSSPLNFNRSATALFPDRYPSDTKPITLNLDGSPLQDHTDCFWQLEQQVLEQNFNNLVKDRLVRGYIKHLSVFGIAPQPLLIKLGALLTDIPATDVYQLHREPESSWSWNENSKSIDYSIYKPREIFPSIAINFSISAKIDNSRIYRILGKNTSIWTVTIDQPHNDCIQSKQDLSKFRTIMRKLYDEIKFTHGENCTLHIFPAVPVSVAIEIGRAKMQKLSINLQLYDENKNHNGFSYAFNI